MRAWIVRMPQHHANKAGHVAWPNIDWLSCWHNMLSRYTHQYRRAKKTWNLARETKPRLGTKTNRQNNYLIPHKYCCELVNPLCHNCRYQYNSIYSVFFAMLQQYKFECHIYKLKLLRQCFSLYRKQSSTIALPEMDCESKVWLYPP